MEHLTILFELLDEGEELISALTPILIFRYLRFTLLPESLTGFVFSPLHLRLKASLVFLRALEQRPLHLLQSHIVVVEIRLLDLTHW